MTELEREAAGFFQLGTFTGVKGSLEWSGGESNSESDKSWTDDLAPLDPDFSLSLRLDGAPTFELDLLGRIGRAAGGGACGGAVADLGGGGNGGRRGGGGTLGGVAETWEPSVSESNSMAGDGGRAGRRNGRDCGRKSREGWRLPPEAKGKPFPASSSESGSCAPNCDSLLYFSVTSPRPPPTPTSRMAPNRRLAALAGGGSDDVKSDNKRTIGTEPHPGSCETVVSTVLEVGNLTRYPNAW